MRQLETPSSIATAALFYRRQHHCCSVAYKLRHQFVSFFRPQDRARRTSNVAPVLVVLLSRRPPTLSSSHRVPSRPLVPSSPRPSLSPLPPPARRFALGHILWIRTAAVYIYDIWISWELPPSWVRRPTRNPNKAFLRTTSLSRRDAASGELGPCD